MKTLVPAVFFFMGLVILGGCLALGPNNLSSYYKNTTVSAELYNGGKIVDLINFRIEEPKKKIVILFNHGTRSWRRVQVCILGIKLKIRLIQVPFFLICNIKWGLLLHLVN